MRHSTRQVTKAIGDGAEIVRWGIILALFLFIFVIVVVALMQL